MTIQQISIFMENKTGCLAEMTAVLADNKINMRALSIAETQDFGILRIIVDEPQKAAQVLQEAQAVYQMTPVLAVVVPDEPGSMAKIVRILAEKDITVEYAYAFITRSVDTACLILRVKDAERAGRELKEHGVQTADDAMLKQL